MDFDPRAESAEREGEDVLAGHRILADLRILQDLRLAPVDLGPPGIGRVEARPLEAEPDQLGGRVAEPVEPVGVGPRDGGVVRRVDDVQQVLAFFLRGSGERLRHGGDFLRGFCDFLGRLGDGWRYDNLL